MLQLRVLQSNTNVYNYASTSRRRRTERSLERVPKSTPKRIPERASKRIPERASKRVSVPIPEIFNLKESTHRRGVNLTGNTELPPRIADLAIPNARKEPETRPIPATIKKSTLNYKASGRILHLAKPAVKQDTHLRPSPAPVTARALLYEPSARIKHLALPIDYEKFRIKTMRNLIRKFGKIKFHKKRGFKSNNDSKPKRKRRHLKRRRRRRKSWSVMLRTLNIDDGNLHKYENSEKKKGEYLNHLSKPMKRLNKVKDLKLPRKINPAALTYEASENIHKLATSNRDALVQNYIINERMRAKEERQELLKSLKRADIVIRKYENFKEGDHINLLAQPKRTREPCELDLKLPRKVKPAALTYQASDNILKLATPKKNWEPAPKIPRKLSEILRKEYVISERLQQLAQPKKQFGAEFDYDPKFRVTSKPLKTPAPISTPSPSLLSDSSNFM